jgi:hypothetical protein
MRYENDSYTGFLQLSYLNEQPLRVRDGESGCRFIENQNLAFLGKAGCNLD